jgi:hypothetical protein
MPPALDWLATAEHCFADDYGSLRQGLLTSVFSLVVGLERVFHLDEMEDPGFARLCGGRRCPSRHTVGGWRRHLPWYEVDAFCRRTSPWHLLHRQDAMVSFDEHTIPRWTKKFHIGKGYSTTRNKYMRCEKLFTGYDLVSGRFLSVRATPGNTSLQDLAVPLLQQVLRQGQPRTLHALFDAGAGKSDAGVRALWDLAEQHANLEVTLRACRYPHRLRAWKQLPSGLFVSVVEPGVCVGAPPKEVRLAETQTVLKDEDPEQALTRTRNKRFAPSSAGRSAPVPKKIVGIRCIPPVPVSRRRCCRSSGPGNTTSRPIAWRSTTCLWTRRRVLTTRTARSGSGLVSSAAPCKCSAGWWRCSTTPWPT